MDMAGLGLDGTVVVVAGGAGNVGRYLVAAFLDAGARVVVPSRSPEKLAALARAVAAGDGRGDRLVTLVGDIAEEGDAARIRDHVVATVGRPGAVVASLGGWQPAPSLIAATPAELRRVLEGNLVAHFVVARAFLPPLLEGGGSYTLINGPAAFQPVPQSGLVSVSTAGQAMLARALFDECAGTPARVNELVIQNTLIGPEGTAPGSPVAGEDVGRYAAYLASPRAADARGTSVRLTSPADVPTLG